MVTWRDIKIPLFCSFLHQQLYMARRPAGVVDFDTMAVEWCKYVNARTIWPKLSAQLRSYYRRWVVNMCVREATRQAAEGKIALAPFNEATATALRARGAPPPVIAASTQLAPAAEGAQAPDAVPQIAGGAVLGLLRRSQHTASQEEERAKTVAPMPGCFEIGASDGDDLHGQVELGKMRGEGGGGSGGGDGNLVQIVKYGGI